MATKRPDGHDVTCPSCDEPVGVRATFCMHCGHDLPERVEYDDVTGATEADDGGETLISRLRPGKLSGRSRESIDQSGTPTVVGASTEPVEAQAATAERSYSETAGGPIETTDDGAGPGTADASVGFGTTDDGTSVGERIPVPSGKGSDGPNLFPTTGLLDESAEATKLLGVLGFLGATGVVGLGLSLVQAGVLLASVAWTLSAVTLARRHSGFDAMRYGSYSLMILVIFVSFALAFGSTGSGLLAFGLTMVPVGIALLFVAGFGYSMGDSSSL